MKPYRGIIYFTVAAPSLDSVPYDQAVTALEQLGIHIDTGGISEMPPGDVIPGSPLHKDLSGGAGTSAPHERGR